MLLIRYTAGFISDNNSRWIFSEVKTWSKYYPFKQLGTLFCALVDCSHHAMTALFKYSGFLACKQELKIHHRNTIQTYTFRVQGLAFAYLGSPTIIAWMFIEYRPSRFLRYDGRAVMGRVVRPFKSQSHGHVNTLSIVTFHRQLQKAHFFLESIVLGAWHKNENMN